MTHSETSQQSSTQQGGRGRVGNGTAFDDEELFGADEACEQIIRNLQSELAEKAQVIEEQQNTIQTLQSDVQGLKKTATKRRKRATAVLLRRRPGKFSQNPFIGGMDGKETIRLRAKSAGRLGTRAGCIAFR